MSSWGEGWAVGVMWGLLSSYPGGWPGGRAVLSAGTYLVYPAQHGSRTGAVFELSEDWITTR